MGQNIIRVLVADDCAVIRKGIRDLLATEPNTKVMGEAGNERETARA
jgi:DNA-binding NarL/FixJ family response regulator